VCVDVISLQGQGSAAGAWEDTVVSVTAGSGGSVDGLNRINSEPQSSAAHSQDRTVEASAENQESSGLEHGSVALVDAVSLQGRRGQSGEAVTVYPLAQAQGADDGSRQDGTARHTSEAVDTAAAGELYLSGARDRIKGQAVNGAAVLADGEHGMVALVDAVSLQGQGRPAGRLVPVPQMAHW
jgi:hypothetical protein